VNLGAVVSFVLAWALRGDAATAPDALVLGLEAIGVALLTAGGWMGGVLVNRNQIGVDHRYAYAGKWKEARIAAGTGEPVVIGQADELKVNQMKLLYIDGRRLVLARTEEGYVVFDDRCTHKGGSLAGGVMIAGIVQCPWHGSQFDCRTGRVKAGPAEQPVESYSVREDQGRILLTLRGTPASAR
ncbi:MAG TPA: Rieske 2Fe-2S domain-containing protein, partial [Gemmatimonadales bacterium]|nr:Rieske 2Fe-2S domain-containing protein [Gemmatimonadales bacterium]